jgi:hypothetical protein
MGVAERFVYQRPERPGRASLKTKSPTDGGLTRQCVKLRLPVPIVNYRLAEGVTAAAVWLDQELVLFAVDDLDEARRAVNTAALDGWFVVLVSGAELESGEALRIVKGLL